MIHILYNVDDCLYPDTGIVCLFDGPDVGPGLLIEEWIVSKLGSPMLESVEQMEDYVRRKRELDVNELLCYLADRGYRKVEFGIFLNAFLSSKLNS